MISLRRFMVSIMSLSMTLSVTLRAQTFPGTVGDVHNIDTASLLSSMNTGSGDLVLVAAHRGYWRDSPENSQAALQAAFNDGIEAIEIDVRMTSDSQLAVSHDANLQRQTTGTGAVSQTPWSTISGLKLRDRFGRPTTFSMLQFTDVLNILSSYADGVTGPVVIVDLKDANPWPVYLTALTQLQSTHSELGPNVIFKMKMKNLPAITSVESEATAHPNYGHIIPVINPEDATDNPNGFDGPDWDNSTGTGDWSPGSSNFQRLFALSKQSNPFVQQFELNSAAIKDGASAYVGPLTSFATYYQPSFYPEGVTFSSGSCCYLPDPISADLRGVLSFSLFYNQFVTPGSSLITTDKLDETLSFLISSGKRNTSNIQ
jgi:hypothetical protein